MSFLAWLADRTILCPSTHPIDAEGKVRHAIPATSSGDKQLEAWVANHDHGAPNEKLRNLTIIKFPGTGGRAERARVHPAECWENFNSEIWTINHLGYGGSDGPATIKSFPESCEAVYQFLADRYPDRPIFVTGNSLGCISALYLAARHPVAGLMLRNPPPLHQLISTRPRYTWWNFGMSRFVANEVPIELDSIANAKSSSAPCLFVQSALDRVVPCNFQDKIIDSYAGPHRKLQIPNVDHHEPIGEDQYDAYVELLHWLEQQVLDS